MANQDDPPDANAKKTSNVIDLPVGRKSRLRRRAKIGKLLHDQYPPLPDNEPMLTWDHWAIVGVMAGSFVAAVVMLIFG